MNAATLYAQLSREVFLLNEDTDAKELMEFMRNDRGFYKLRNLLLCRSCRELCVEPYSSEFCNHLMCKKCFEGKLAKIAGCKWCRVTENLNFDMNSNILIGLYKNLCAILRDFLSGRVNKTGSIPEYAKLLRFLEEGCIIPTVTNIEKIVANKKDLRNTNSKVVKEIDKPECPPCCCTCKEIDKTENKTLSSDSFNTVYEQNFDAGENKNSYSKSSQIFSDNVTSTVPEIVAGGKNSEFENQNKYGADGNGGTSKLPAANQINKNEKIPIHNDNKLESASISQSQFYKTLSSISLKERSNRDIFEKFGLALTPPLTSEIPLSNSSEEYTPKKPKKRKTTKAFIEKESKKLKTEPRLKPLNLKLKKVTTTSDIPSYSVQYNITNGNEKIDIDSSMLGHESTYNIADNINASVKEVDVSAISDSLEESQPKATERKLKRKATFIRNYAIFSDDSDFEPYFYQTKRKTKRHTKRERDICGCGAGSHVKYFTDICKRSRCPCYSQGRACINCKCRFCSNPYMLDDEIEEVCSSSDASQGDDSLTSSTQRDEELVDVEA